ncbi:putative G-protein coupled receptor 132 isoform X1 [Huso huso]|uniref:G-protein coupled receptor 132 isoform X1 n=1 Tax=Huso huso TaxID=61971 RepID=A0ABR0Z8X4_HUSHU
MKIDSSHGICAAISQEHQEAGNKLTETMANNSNESCKLPYDEDRIPLVVLYSIVFIIGVPANFVTVILTYKQVQRKNVLGIYLFSLSLCDLMYLFTLPLWVSYVNNDHEWLWSPVSCKITGYVFFNNMYISIFLLCCISIDRYVAVVYAVESRGLRRQKLAAIITCIICIVVPIGHVPVFTMKEDDTGQVSKKCFEPGKASAMVTGFNYARFFIGFFLPLCILIVTNYCILTNIQASTGLLGRSKMKVKCLAITVIVLFLVCFGPYHIILLLRAVMYHILEEGQNCDFGKQIYIPYTICLGLSTFNSAMNPILYVLASDNIRKELKRGLLSFRSRTSLQHRGTDSSLPKFPTSKNSVDAAQTLENNNQ